MGDGLRNFPVFLGNVLVDGRPGRRGSGGRQAETPGSGTVLGCVPGLGRFLGSVLLLLTLLTVLTGLAGLVVPVAA